MCRHEGFPLVTMPGANVFYTDRDVSTPPDANGDQLISCKQDLSTKAAWQIQKAARYLARLAEGL